MKLAQEINIFVEEIRALGPLGWNRKLAGNGQRAEMPLEEVAV
jgi:hypothetical protein